MERPEPRTLLERLVQQSDRTQEEICADFERCARRQTERGATLSLRQLSRWMTGAVTNARPASRREARQETGTFPVSWYEKVMIVHHSRGWTLGGKRCRRPTQYRRGTAQTA